MARASGGLWRASGSAGDHASRGIRKIRCHRQGLMRDSGEKGMPKSLPQPCRGEPRVSPVLRTPTGGRGLTQQHPLCQIQAFGVRPIPQYGQDPGRTEPLPLVRRGWGGPSFRFMPTPKPRARKLADGSGQCPEGRTRALPYGSGRIMGGESHAHGPSLAG